MGSVPVVCGVRMRESLITALVVLYNKELESSKTLQALRKHQIDSVIIVDNSTLDFNNQQAAQEYAYTYVTKHENLGLAKAYNLGIKSIKKECFVCLFDDDTIISEDYFNVLKTSVEKYPEVDIWLPIVKAEEEILSPFYVYNGRVASILDLKSLDSNHIAGINSGMAIRSRIFDQYEYDENYFLDYIDHAFIRDMRQQKMNISVLDTTLMQEYSRVTQTYEQSRSRFKIQKKDMKYYYSQTMSQRYKGFIEILKIRYFLFRKFKKMEIWFL